MGIHAIEDVHDQLPRDHGDRVHLAHNVLCVRQNKGIVQKQSGQSLSIA